MATNKKNIIELPETVSRIGAQSTYDGDLHFESSLSILGTAKGRIVGGELLVVHPNATVIGEIVVDYLLVLGSVKGNIHTRRGCYFYEGSFIRGSVLSAIMRIQTGVDFEGECNLIEDKNKGVDVFTLSRDEFHSSMFDKLVHELDEVSEGHQQKNVNN